MSTAPGTGPAAAAVAGPSDAPGTGPSDAAVAGPSDAAVPGPAADAAVVGPRRLIVGAGPVGTSLAQALRGAGQAPLLWSRREGPLPSGAPADVVVLAVRDDAIASVAAEVVRLGAAGPQSVLLHCAGSLPPGEAFAAVADKVGGIGLWHPLRSLSRPVADLRGTVMAVCGDPPGQAAARTLAEDLGGLVLPLLPAQLSSYHAAAVLAAGHAAALLGVAAEVLVQTGLPRRDAERALAALCRSMTENVDAIGLPLALTGPFARGDVRTVARHLDALAGAAARPVYLALAAPALRLAADKGQASPADLASLFSLLERARKG